MKQVSAIRPVIAWMLLVGLCALSLLVKSPDALQRPQFWAEDGVVFFARQWVHDLPLLFSPYAGYLHIIPRTVAWFTSFWPAIWSPMIFNTAAIVIDAACVAYLVARLLPFRMSMIAFAGVFLTPTNGEIFGTLTNVQWFAQLFLLTICFLPSSNGAAVRPWRGAWMVVAILACALSGPFSTLLALIYVALGLASLCLRKMAWQHWVVEYHAALDHRLTLPLVCLCGLVQAVVALTAGSNQPTEPSLANALQALAFAQPHTFGVQLVSSRIFLPAVGIIVTVVAFGRLPAAWKGFLLTAMAFALLQIVASSSKFHLIGADLGHGDRYYFLFKIVFWLTLASAAAAVFRSRRQAASLTMACALLVALVNHRNLQRSPLPDKNWQEFAARIDRGEDVMAEINPSWSFHIPAERQTSRQE